MELFITVLHVFLCFFLILVVLLQPGKGADFGAAMGGASQEVMGAAGSISLLSKLTAVVAAMFMATSLGLAWFSNAPEDSALGIEDLLEEAGADQDSGDTAGSSAPAEDTEAAPAEGAEAPAEGAEAPAEGAEAPAEGAEPPAEGAEAGEAVPAEGEAAPAEGAEAAPAEGEAAPAEGTEAPADEAAGSAE